MFFQWLGQIVRRWWFLLLTAWALLIVGTKLVAPPWNQIAQGQEFAFLPADAPSRRAGEIYARAFPEDRLSSTIVLVLSRDRGTKAALDEDLKFIEDVVEPGLREIARAEGGLAVEAPASDEPLFGDDAPVKPKEPEKRSIIARIRTPNAPGSGSLLISADGQATLVILELTTEFLSRTNWPTIAKVEDFVTDLKANKKVSSGLDIAMTGSAVIGRDQTQAELRSARATEVLTVILVIGLLVVIYRAPLLAIIPLLTVYLSVQLSLNVLALLGDAGYLRIFQSLKIYITILTYGAGVDYCLFLTARYQEELDKGFSPADAVAHAVRGVGLALLASAATVMFGIGMMMFAEFGKFREAGFAIPLSLFFVLCATLTFSASLLRMAGRFAFWPRKPSAAMASTGKSPEEPHGWHQEGGLERAWDRVAHLLLRRSGAVWSMTVALMAPFVIAGIALYNRVSYDMIGNLPANAPSVAGTRALQDHFPAGMIGEVTVLLIQPQSDFGSPQGRTIVERVTEQLRAERDELGLADIRSLTAPLGITEAAKSAQGLKDIKVDPQTRREATERAARDRYTSSLGERQRVGTRLNLTLVQSPFSHWSIHNLDHIEQAVRNALPENLRQDSQVHFIGTTASVRDLATVMQRDRTRIEILVLASVLLILILLLRQVAVSVYLLLSVLFSYYATMGASFAVFWLLDPHGFNGIDWKVAIFLFTILIAVGEDYNIFLIARINEEEKNYGRIRGITHALTRTGPIISSCGIIMAGTFAALLGASLTEMKQLGFALAFGVLLDTFVVRPVLVPAFLLLLASGRVPLLRKTAKQLGDDVRSEGPKAMSQSM